MRRKCRKRRGREEEERRSNRKQTGTTSCEGGGAAAAAASITELPGIKRQERGGQLWTGISVPLGVSSSWTLCVQLIVCICYAFWIWNLLAGKEMKSSSITNFASFVSVCTSVSYPKVSLCQFKDLCACVALCLFASFLFPIQRLCVCAWVFLGLCVLDIVAYWIWTCFPQNIWIFPKIAKLFIIFQIFQNVWHLVWQFSNISTTYQPYKWTKFRDTPLKSWVVLKVHWQSYQTCQFKFQITTSVCVCVCVCVSCF
jgi:hypothetical protein